MFKKVKDKPYYTNNHSCFLLTAHLVLVTKYRKPVLQGKVRDYVYALIKETMESENIIIREAAKKKMPIEEAITKAEELLKPYLE